MKKIEQIQTNDSNIDIIQVNNIKYKFIDFRKSWTLLQQMKAKSLIKQFVKKANSGNTSDNLSMIDLLDLFNENEILAFFYLPENCNKFDNIIYEKTANEFLEINFTKEMQDRINDFFTFKMKSIMDSILTSLTGLGMSPPQ